MTEQPSLHIFLKENYSKNNLEQLKSKEKKNQRQKQKQRVFNFL